MKGRDLFKLVLALAILALVVYGIYRGTDTSNRNQKYTHPITRSGAHW